MGNSEVGHMNLGAGRVVMQDLPRIDKAVADGSLAKNKALAEFIAKLKKSGGTAHLLGLLSPGGVHSHQDHMAALAKLLDAAGIPVVCHAFLDGRDTPPKSALDYLARFDAATKGLKNFRFGTVGGRYFGMDRDKRWDRDSKAYEAMVEAKGEHANDAKSGDRRRLCARRDRRIRQADDHRRLCRHEGRRRHRVGAISAPTAFAKS